MFILNELGDRSARSPDRACDALASNSTITRQKSAMEAASTPTSKTDHSVAASSHAHELRGTNGPWRTEKMSRGQ